MSELDLRSIDYYIKGLPFDVRQEIFKGLRNIGNATVECLLEKNEGYTRYKEMSLTEEEILYQIKKASEKFGAVNNTMTENERYPLFENPSDTYKSSQEYVNLLKRRTKEELIEEFGCSWDEYVPEIYIV